MGVKAPRTDSTEAGQAPKIVGNFERASPLPSVEPNRVVGERHIDAVIQHISGQHCIVRCDLAAGPVDLRIPLSYVPNELLMHGQPVTVSLDRSLGYRVPKVEARQITMSGASEDERQILEWAYGP
jgi:hypothetical protein